MSIGLPTGMSRDDAYVQGVSDTEERVVSTIKQHVPSLTDEDDDTIVARSLWREDGEIADSADLAVRTCSCGVKIDGFYAYVDHLIEVFGGESHLAG